MLENWARLAEIVGAGGVIGSLIYVGLQIRKNTAAVHSAAAQAVHDNYSAWYSSLQSDPGLLSISINGMRDYSCLSEVEKAQFIAMFMSFSSYSQNAFHKWREGSLSPELWKGWELVTMNFISTPGGKEFWKERGYVFGEAYRRHVETEIMPRKPHPDARPWGAFPIDD